MTLAGIITKALSDLDYGTDTHVMEKFTRKFTNFANDAMADIAESFKPTCIDTIINNGSPISFADLSRKCLKIIKISNDSNDVSWCLYGTDKFIVLAEEGVEVKIEYQYVPNDMSSLTDEPDLPSYLHRLIPIYVVGRQRMVGDPYAQNSAGVHMQQYDNSKNKVLKNKHRGQPSSYKIYNKW